MIKTVVTTPYTIYLINFTATTATFGFNYLILIGLSGGRIGGRRVTVVAEEGHSYQKMAIF